MWLPLFSVAECVMQGSLFVRSFRFPLVHLDVFVLLLFIRYFLFLLLPFSCCSAGNASAGWADGRGTQVMFNTPYSITFEPSTGNAFIADHLNYRVRKVTPDGNVTTAYGRYSSILQHGCVLLF
jgi:hypothetical protein